MRAATMAFVADTNPVFHIVYANPFRVQLLSPIREIPNRVQGGMLEVDDIEWVLLGLADMDENY